MNVMVMQKKKKKKKIGEIALKVRKNAFRLL